MASFNGIYDHYKIQTADYNGRIMVETVSDDGIETKGYLVDNKTAARICLVRIANAHILKSSPYVKVEGTLVHCDKWNTIFSEPTPDYPSGMRQKVSAA